jgi:hypothetical protein
MINPEDVKAQLLASLPVHTNIFGSNIVPSAVSVLGGVVRVTKNAHGLASGNVVVVTKAVVRVPITSVAVDGGAALITTSILHDRTSGAGEKQGFNKAIHAGFADASYNKEFDILDILSNTTYLVAADAEPVGDLGYLKEPRNLFLGPAQVTVVDVDTFTIPLADRLENGIVFDTFEYSDKQEIYIAADEMRAVTKYAQRTNPPPTLYIIMGAETASKDKDTQSDALLLSNSQNEARMMYLQEVSLLACFKTAEAADHHMAAATQQGVYSALRPALRKAMYNHVFEPADGNITPFASIEAGNMPVRWNTGYYIHRFTYMMPYSITLEQGNTVSRSVSFRQIIMNSQIAADNDSVSEETVSEISLKP